jgi:hypothetical protein
MAVPYTFGNATSSIPLSQLDNNFATAITIGNTAVQLGNTITTINNLTLANVTISSVATAVTPVEGGTGLTSVGTTGNVLTSNGTAWISQAPAASASSISNGTSNVSISSSNGNITAYTNGALAMTIDTNQNTTHVGTSVMGSSFLRNRIINGNMAVDQRNTGAAQTITAAAALAYTVDRWYAYSTGANVTGQRVQGASANQYRYQFTGAASVTAIGFAQRIEAINSADLAGSTATLSVDISNSLLTTVTWTAYYANTTDTFGTLASPTVTSIATGSFTVTSTVTRYNAQISIPSAATTGLQIVFTVGAQTSGAWVIGNVQLEPGSVATPFERPLYSKQLADCQRYYQKFPAILISGYAGISTVYYSSYLFPVELRTIPTILYSNFTNSNSGNASTNAVGTKVWRVQATMTALGNGFSIFDAETSGTEL